MMTEQEAKDWLKAISATITYGACAEQRKEALFVGMQALDKQIAKEPMYSEFSEDDEGENLIAHKAECPNCGDEFEFGTWNVWDNPYCSCGQKIKWG